MRGSEKVGWRRCPTCDRTLYFALGAPYLCPEPPPEAQILSTGKSLVVRDVVLRSIDFPKRLHVEPLGVQREPLDGLPLAI